MRVGIVRKDPTLPDIDRQARILTDAANCTRIIEAEGGGVGVRRLDRQLQTLKGGDVVCVAGLNALSPNLGRLVKMIHNLAAARVSVCIADGKGPEVMISPDDTTTPLLRLLSACDPHRQAPPDGSTVWHGRRFPPAEDLTTYQRDHIHKLHKDGMSLRAIGLIFRTSPGEVSRILEEGRWPAKTSPAGKSV